MYNLLVLNARNSSAGVVQRQDGAHGEDSVEWVDQELGVLASQPQRLGGVLVLLL